MKKLTLCALAVMSINAYAKQTSSGDIVGRDLNTQGAGWIGHTAMATGDPFGETASIVIETLNESPVIQLNSLLGFASRSKLWGSKYTIAGHGYDDATFNSLREFNFQRWWCPKYTISSIYQAGSGDPRTGKVFQCGTFRCDTSIAYSFMVNGIYAPINAYPMLPKNLFPLWSYWNNVFINKNESDIAPKKISSNKIFINLNANDLNDMSFDEFSMIADTPRDQTTPDHLAKELDLANDPDLHEVKRGMFIDRISMLSKDNIIHKFILMYEKENNEEVKNKLLGGMMTQYQNNQELLKDEELKYFYEKMLFDKKVIKDDSFIVRGYIDTHKSDEIIKNRDIIDEKLESIEPNLALGLRNNLAHTSIELENIYIPLILNILKKSHRDDLNDMFFGITKMGYKDLKNPNSLKLIKSYVNYMSEQYSNKNYKPNPYTGMAKMSLNELSKEIN